jgi:hypothetical protein
MNKRYNKKKRKPLSKTQYAIREIGAKIKLKKWSNVKMYAGGGFFEIVATDKNGRDFSFGRYQ